MKYTKSVKCISKLMCFIMVTLLVLSTFIVFSFESRAAAPLDWEEYAHSDKYYVRIGRGNSDDEEFRKYYSDWDKNTGFGNIEYCAYDKETNKLVVSQELWYKLETNMKQIIPIGAKFPDIHVDQFGERYGEYESEIWAGEAQSDVYFHDPAADQDADDTKRQIQNECTWKLKCDGGIYNVIYLMENQFPGIDDKYHDVEEFYDSFKEEIAEQIRDDTYQSEYNSDNAQINVQTYDYEISDGKVFGRAATFSEDIYTPQEQTDNHEEKFKSMYIIPRELNDVPLVAFGCAVNYHGEMRYKKDRKQGKYSRPQVDEAKNTFLGLREKIEQNALRYVTDTPIDHQWQEPVWADASNESVYKEDEIEQHAKEDEGEDSGVGIDWDIVEKPDPIVKPEWSYNSDYDDNSLPAAVGVGVGGALAAGAAIAASSGKGKTGKKSKKKEKPKSYKMFVSKDFGDAIRKGAAPVIVRARIMEIVEGGTRKPRLDLTKNISVSGEGLQIGSVTMTGMWMDAEVYADEQSTAKEGTVIFTFTGEGGTFRNRVVFRLVGQPFIVYPDTDLTSTEMVLKMIANDTEKYSVRFFFEDAIDDPQKLLLSAGDRFGTATRAAENVRTYYADVTAKPRLETTDVFVAPEREYIGIHAAFKNGDVVDSGFYVEIWPEGLSVTSRHVKNDRLEIDTVANPEAGDLDYKIRPTDFEVRFAYRDKASGQPVFLTGEHLKPTFSAIYEVDKYGNTFTENFRFAIDTQFDLYAFEPQDTLPMLKEPYQAMIDIVCEAGGETYTMPLPLSFYGEKPLLPSNAEWQTVYKKLKRAVQVFGVGADPDARAMIREAKTMSAADLEYVRYWIILCGKLYYENERREYAEIDKVMTNHIIVASALVKIGDKAVETAIKLKWPNADSSIIAAFINPWKNALAEFIGQYVAKFSLIDLSEGDPEDFDFIKTMLDSCQSGLQEIITGEEVIVEPKTGGKIVSLYMMVCFAKHYFYGEGNEKGDIFKSVIETFKDLTMAKLKAYFTELLKDAGEYLGKVADYVGKYSGKILKYVGYEKGLELAKLAYENQVRLAIRNSGELSNAAYKAAKGISETVMNQNMDSIGKELSEAGVAAAKWTAEYGLAAIINYISKGTKKESEAYGVTTPEVLVELGVDRGEDLLKLLSEAINERWHINIMKYYIDAKKSVNDALDVSARLDGELLIMSFYGYTVEINIVENADAIFGIFYEICFGWMEDLWKSMQSNDPNWDPRDDLSDDTTMVDRMTERVKSLGSSANITYKD